jgi:hypothetical protein
MANQGETIAAVLFFLGFFLLAKFRLKSEIQKFENQVILEFSNRQN